MPDTHPEPFGPAEFQAVSNVSRETLARLKLFVSLLEDWNARMNLVSAKSLADVWKRHVWDSALAAFSASAVRRAKLRRSGKAGPAFPGVVLAILLGGETRTVLYEAVAKKCRFLEEVTHRTGLTAEIRNSRIEDAKPEPFDVVTARACAPLDQLLSYAAPFQAKNTQCLFLKGQSVGAELTDAYKSWSMTVQQHPSRSDPSGVVLDIRELRHGHRH